MAVSRNYAIPQAREAIAVIRFDDGEAINVHATREFYRWMSLIERLVGPGGPLATVEDGVVNQADDIANNADAIDTNNTSITAINLDLATITINLSALATQVSTLTIDFNDHILLNEAHGSNGNIVGFSDIATVGQVGLVGKAVDPGIPVFVTVADAQAWATTLRVNLVTAGVL